MLAAETRKKMPRSRGCIFLFIDHILLILHSLESILQALEHHAHIIRNLFRHASVDDDIHITRSIAFASSFFFDFEFRSWLRSFWDLELQVLTIDGLHIDFRTEDEIHDGDIDMLGDVEILRLWLLRRVSSSRRRSWLMESRPRGGSLSEHSKNIRKIE